MFNKPLEMSTPSCPICGERIEWKHSFSLWNPWNYPCPHCKVSLEGSKIQKYIALAVIPVGLLLAAVPIVLEQAGVWSTKHSFLFFAIVVPVLLIGARASWPYTRFTERTK
jgi:hypothetical protein